MMNIISLDLITIIRIYEFKNDLLLISLINHIVLFNKIISIIHVDDESFNFSNKSFVNQIASSKL